MPLFKTLKIRYFKNGMAQYIEHAGGHFWKLDFFHFFVDVYVVPENVLVKLKINILMRNTIVEKTFHNSDTNFLTAG